MTPDQQKTPLALIVDDDAVDRLMARAALESSGWNVEEAENGREALATFQRLHPDVVLLDIMMPEMDGFTVCAALRKLPEGEHTPILVMTGQEDYNSIMRAYDAGATDFLTKPLNGLLLKHRVQYIVRSSRALQDLRTSQVILAQSERRLRFTQFAVDHAEDGVLWADDSKRFMYANEAACRLLGYSNEELLTLSISDIAPYHDPTRFQQRLDQIKQGTAATYESIHRRKNGTEFPVEASVNYLEHEGKGYTCGIVRDITERKRIEQERAQALADLHNVIESIPDVVFALNTQGNLVKWNRRLEDVTGYSPEELLSMPALAFVPPEEHICTAAAIQRAFMEGYAELEGHLLTKDHRIIPYHWTGALLKNPQGEPIGITGIGRDMSDKKSAEEALRRSEERLVLAVEGSNDILWDAQRLPGEPWYAPQTPIWWSPRVRELLGLQESDLFETLEHWVARLHPDDKDHVFGQLAAHIEQRVPYDVEYRLRTNAGDFRWIRGRGQALWDDQGEPRRMSGSCQDITERKQVEKALCESEERYRMLIDLSPNGVFVYCDGKKVYVNQAACTILGASSPEQLLENPTFRFSHPDAYELIHTSLAQILATGEPVRRVERKYQRLDGTAVFVEVDAGRIMWNGEPAVQVIFADITERKRAEEERQKQELLIALMLNTGPACIKRVAADGSLLHMNPTGLKLVEACGEPEVVGRSVFDLIIPEHRDAFISMHRSVIEGHVRTLQFEIQGLKGTRRWMESYAAPFRNPVTGQTEQLAVTHDITHRKQAEEALRESEAFNISVLNSLSSQVVVLNSQGVIMAVNKPWLRFAEENEASHLVENFVGMNYLNVCAQAPLFANGEEAALAQAGILAVLAGTQNEFSLEYPCHSQDQRRWFRMRVTPLLNSQAGVVVAHENISERKQAQEKRYQSEMQLQAILDNSPSLIFLKDLDGRYLRVNREFETLFGTTETETVGRTDRDIFPPEQAALFQGNDEKVLQGGMAMLFEEVAVCGNNRHVSIVQKFPLRDKEGVLYAIGGIATDITERKWAEEALRKREEALARFKVTLDQTHDCVFMFAPDTLRFIYCNRGAIEQVGYTEAELFTMTPIDIKPKFTKQSFCELLDSLRDGSKPSCVFETVHRHKDGHDVAVEVSLQLVREQGVEGRFVAVVRDITERKQAEEALRESEERFGLAVRGSNTGIWDWDLRTGKTYFSPHWKSMLGYEEHELQGEFFEWEERLHPDDRERSSATVRAYLEGTTPQYELEHRLRHKDGGYRWILARGVSICDTEGKPYRMAGSHIDITEQKQTQEALVQSERQLRTVLDALPVGVWFTDRAGKPLLANPAAKQIWSNIKQIGLQTENNQTGWWESIGAANEPHRWALSQVLTTGVPSLNETFDFECLDGTKKAIRNSTVPVKNQDGVILGAIVLNEDITALREAQAALQLTQFSVDHAVEGFLWIGSDARIFHVNGSICRMLDYTWEELTAMTLYDIDPNLSAGVWPAHWEELKEKGSLTFESKYWSRTGRVQDMEVTANYLQYEGKEYNCAIMRDISERKRAEAALRASEERYRSLYDETPTMYFTLAVDGTVRSVNRFGAEQLGFQAEELIGHSVRGLYYEADREAVAASLSECLATPETTRYWEFRKLRKDGSMIWVREAARVGWSDTEETVVLVTCEDITERKQAEHESRERTRQVLAMQAARLELAHLDDTRRTFSEVLSQVTPIVANTLAVERVSLWLLSEDQTELVCQDLYLRSQATHSAGSRLAASSYPRYLAVLKESLVIAASNAGVDQRTSEFADDYFFALGITSVLDVPIRRQGKLVGVLWCEHVGMPREWAFEAQDFGASVGQTIVRMMEASERTQAEDRLRATQYAVDHATDYIFVIGSNGYFLDVNKSACRRLGYTKDELLTKSVMDIDPDFPPATWESFWEELKHKKLLCLESRHRSKSGEIYPVEVIANYILHEGKELDYAFVRDITERKRAEKELQKSYSFLRQVIDLDPNFIFAKDREGRFTLANKAVADAYGTTVENLVGKTDTDFNPNQEEVAFFRQDDLAVIDNLNELFLPEEVITDSDGRTRWLQTVKRPILDDEGCAIMVLGASTDITERKRMEETLRQRERALQMAIEERERISQDLHDGILQSLFAVGLALESAKLTMPSRNLKVFRASLNQAIDQLNDVMREIRNFIAGLGSDPLQGKDLPMALKQMLASLTEHQATRVRLAVEDRAAKALSTEQSLHLIRVIQEAVSNCIKHGHAKEARVSLKMLKRGVRLSVRDNGRGFNQDNAKRTGHGLANMAARARKIGGQFTILSKVNKGTSIVLDFPKEAADVSR